MARFNCLVTLLVGRKKKSKDSPKAVDAREGSDGYDTLRSKAEELVKGTTFGSSIAFTVKEVGDDNLLRVETEPEAAYEGGDEHDETLSMKRDFSDFDLQAKAAEDGVNGSPESFKLNPKVMENKSERDEGFTPDLMIQSGHVSDPGIGRIMTFWGSPVLKRSCSNIETKRRVNQALISPTKSHSYNNLRNMMVNTGETLNEFQSSPLSVQTNCSADKVMLKKRSSSQMLPSRSRKLWWKLFLWSHRNLHNPQTTKPQRFVSTHAAPNQKGGYSSDTIEPTHSTEKKNKKAMEETGNGINTGFLWPQNQWVAFTAESSPVDRVNAWVNSLEASPSGEMDGNGNDDEPTDDIVFPSSLEIGEPSGRNRAHGNRRGAEEVVQANNIIQSLNMLSSVAHISGMGLKVVPAISAFSSLRAINLSGNFIVHITPGTLPKSLHTLDLSRNKIAMIEGLRDLTRLRVLNLSYNRISRIGHGLSSCTLVKELYLAGNKISDVEGLHRLLKLTVLDLSFNKITTPKALGQLVANYNSLLALNLLGNPIQSNIGDDQLRKSVTGLLPQLTYLNKQPIKPQRVREVATDSVAKAALGNGRDWSSRRRMTTKRLNQSSSSSSVKGRDGANYTGLGSGRPKSSGHRLKTRK